MKADTVIEVVEKLVGPIGSIGEQNVDDNRFENLKVACELVDLLLQRITNESRLTNYEDSMPNTAERVRWLAGLMAKTRPQKETPNAQG